MKIEPKFNPGKCISLKYSSKAPAGCHPTIFNLARSQIPYLEDGSPTTFLGKNIGAFIPRDSVKVDSIRQRGIKIMTSILTLIYLLHHKIQKGLNYIR